MMLLHLPRGSEEPRAGAGENQTEGNGTRMNRVRDGRGKCHRERQKQGRGESVGHRTRICMAEMEGRGSEGACHLSRRFFPGLPEEKQIARAALRHGLAVLAVSPGGGGWHPSCWDTPRDVDQGTDLQPVGILRASPLSLTSLVSLPIQASRLPFVSPALSRLCCLTTLQSCFSPSPSSGTSVFSLSCSFNPNPQPPPDDWHLPICSRRL